MFGLADAFRAIEVKKLYYLAHLDNIPSILEQGILSRNLVNTRQLLFHDFSLQSAQRKRSRILVGGRTLHDYVPLFMNRDSPMFESLRRKLGDELTCTGVSISVVDKPGVYFSDGNMAYQGSGRTVYSTPEEVRQLRLLDVVSPYGDNLARGAEVLVPDSAGVQYILWVLVDRTVLARLRAGPNGNIFHEFTW